MVSRRREDDRSIRRRGPSRPRKRRILVVCEGKRTEPGYFRAFKDALRNPLVEIKTKDSQTSPHDIVKTARRMKAQAESDAQREHDENLKWDEVWGVFDIDANSEKDIREAYRQATYGSILLAISNPCFELWALLHFQEQKGHIERHRASDALRKHLPDYEKALDYTKMHAGYGDAVRRANVLDDEAIKDGSFGRNPTTGVYRLTESICRDAPGR